MKKKKVIAYVMMICIIVLGTCGYRADNPDVTGPYLGMESPGTTPEIFAPHLISHGFHENGIIFSPDGSELFYSISDSRYVSKTFIRMTCANNMWSHPEIASFSGNYYTHSAFYSPDGTTLFFSSKHPVSNTMETKDDLDVWIVKKKGGNWSEPVHLPGPLNTRYDEQITSMAANGSIYLRANYDGPGKWAIYCSRLIDGVYGAAEKLGDSINSGHFEGNPFVAPDERYLLFKSNRPGGFGNSDLYVSFREGDSWGQPRNLGPAVNSSENELEPRISPDGKYLFFTSFRKQAQSLFQEKSYSELMELYKSPANGYGTLYWVETSIIWELKDR